jgi:hypothetical protein
VSEPLDTGIGALVAAPERRHLDRQWSAGHRHHLKLQWCRMLGRQPPAASRWGQVAMALLELTIVSAASQAGTTAMTLTAGGTSSSGSPSLGELATTWPTDR